MFSLILALTIISLTLSSCRSIEKEETLQVWWAGEEAVLNKKFATKYSGFPVRFSLKSDVPGSYLKNIPNVVGRDGFVRVSLISERAGENEVTVELYNKQGEFIREHRFLVFFLKLQELKPEEIPPLGEIQAYFLKEEKK